MSRRITALLLMLAAASLSAQEAGSLLRDSFWDIFICIATAIALGFVFGWFHLSRLEFRLDEMALTPRARFRLGVATALLACATEVTLYFVNRALAVSWWGAALLAVTAAAFWTTAAATTHYKPTSTCPNAFFTSSHST